MAGWITMIFGMLCVLIGILCFFMPNYIKNWINKQPEISLRLLGGIFSLLGLLMILYLLSFSKLWQLLMSLFEP